MTGDLTFLYGESVPRCTHRIDKVFADYCTLQYMSGGGVSLSVGTQHFELRGHWFWSAYPGPRISFHAADGHRTWRHRYIAFRGKRVERWKSRGLFPIAPQQPPANVDFASRFDALLNASRRTDALGTLRAVNLLEGILIDLAEARSQSHGDAAWLEKTLAALRAGQAGAALDYQTIAASIGMSERTLRRRFLDATGMAPHEYVLHGRIAEARRMLGETDLPIKAIADTLGYRDVFFFTRQFRQLAGVPPATYRRSRQH